MTVALVGLGTATKQRGAAGLFCAFVWHSEILDGGLFDCMLQGLSNILRMSCTQQTLVPTMTPLAKRNLMILAIVIGIVLLLTLTSLAPMLDGGARAVSDTAATARALGSHRDTAATAMLKDAQGWFEQSLTLGRAGHSMPALLQVTAAQRALADARQELRDDARLETLGSVRLDGLLREMQAHSASLVATVAAACPSLATPGLATLTTGYPQGGG